MNARRFEPGFRTDLHGLQDFLARHGYELTARYPLGFSIKGAGNTIKQIKWTAVINFVDQIRIKSGLEPIRRTR